MRRSFVFLVVSLCVGSPLVAQEIVVEDFEDRSIAPLQLDVSPTTTASISNRRFLNDFVRVFHDFDESNASLSYQVQQPESWQGVDVEFRTRFPQGIPFPDYGTVKLARVGDGRGGEFFTIVYFYQPDPPQYYLSYQTRVDGNGPFDNIPITLRRNRWDTIRYRAQFNPRGQNTGTLQIWFNGELLADVTGINFYQGEVEPIVPNLVLTGMNANVLDKQFADDWVPFTRDIDDVRILINP